MDYLAEIAGAPDAREAVRRLAADPDAPRHLLEFPCADLHTKVPAIWRAELTNWLYCKPAFAARLWLELRYCRVHRERVARAAITTAERRPIPMSGIDVAKVRASLERYDRILPWYILQPIAVQAIAAQYGYEIVLTDREAAIGRLANAMKPAAPLDPQGPIDQARALLNDLSEATKTTYEPPAFIARLIVEIVASERLNLFTGMRRRPTAPKPEELIANRGEVLRLAAKHAVPVPFAFVHNEELNQITHTRQRTARAGAYDNLSEPECDCDPSTPVGEIPDASPIRHALAANLVGLAFSGGGIRSATFNLGVLQALSKLDVLRYCDYLSTVSGGGYIGSFFSAWLHREGERIHKSSEPPPNPASEALDELRRCLAPNRSPDPLGAPNRPIRYLREFSNYLTPRTGFFSADTWTMAAIYIRNLILNLLVLLPLLASALLIPRVVFRASELLLDEQRSPLWLPGAMAGLLFISACVLVLNLRRATPPRNVSDLDERLLRKADSDERVPWFSKQLWIQGLVVLPLLIVAWLTTLSYWLAVQGRWFLLPGRELLIYWWDRWTLPLLSILPQSIVSAAILAAAVTFAVAGFYLMVRKLPAGLPVEPKELLAAMGLSALSAVVTWVALRIELSVFDSLPNAPSLARALAAAFLLIVLVVILIVSAGRKTLLKRAPLWLTPISWTFTVGTVTACMLFAGQQYVAVLVPSDTISAISLAAASTLFIFLTTFGATNGFTVFWPKPWRAIGSLVLALIGSAIAAFWTFWGLGKLLAGGMFSQMEGFWHAVAFGTPLTMAAFALVVVIQLGLLGINFPDEQREWWSRLRAWTLIYSAAWTGFFVLAVYPPVWAGHLVDKLPNWGGAGAIALWLISTIAGVKTGSIAAAADKKSRETSGPLPASAPPEAAAKPMSATALKVVASVAPYIFMLGVLAFLSLVIHWILPDADYDSRYNGDYWGGLAAGGSLLGVALTLFVFSWLISTRVGVNEFSMHHFYKNRLVRCYLGASRWQDRKADWFTGFDSADDIRLKKFDRRAPGTYKYPGPYPIVNCALNLVGGQDLAWQERKASSFTFTPKYCGYDVDRAVLSAQKRSYWPDAYAPTSSYFFDKLGPMLGTAMAISGAAANPNMGKVTTAASAFLMTVFNVRLGWWLPNSRRRDRWTKPAPRFGVRYAALELFGLTDDRQQYVNVSDGGHFENLGVYELIRRGCRYIIACDAGQDGSLGMEDLGNLIRRCRTDFGVEIDIAIDRIRDRDKHGWSTAHCVVGTIRYPGVAKHCKHGRVLLNDGMPEGEEGLLIYLKPSISGDEPYDILEYYTRVPEFPHETTADQWFNESQFESYRRLGLHIAETAFKQYRENEDAPVRAPELFERLRHFWYPPSPKVAEYSTEHTLEYSRILELVRSNEDFRFLDPELFADMDTYLGQRRRDEFYICNALIQLIENVYADLDLEQNYNHPHVGGWMRVFRQWSKQPSFARTWRQSRGTYAERFRSFYDDRLVNGSGE